MKYIISLGLVIDLFTPGNPAMISASLSDAEMKPVSRKMTRVPGEVINGFSTFDPNAWRDAVFTAIRETVEESGVDPRDIVSVSGTAHPDNVILLDENGESAGRGLVCHGYDFAAEKSFIESCVSRGDMVKYIRNGFGIGSMIPTAEILVWHMLNTPEIWAKCRHMLVTKDYFAYCLTGEYATEPTDACFSLLYDPVENRWSEDMARALGVDPAILPKVVKTGEVVGLVTPEAAEKTGLAVGTRVLAGATNKACVEIMSMAAEEGEGVYSYSIFSNLVVHTKNAVTDPDGNLALCSSMLPGEYYLMCDNRTHTYAFNWFGGNFVEGFEVPRGKVGLPYEKTEALAAESPIGANGVLFLPYLDGEETPVFDDNAKGVFYGITRNTTKADMMRAVMEGTAFSARETFEYIETKGVKITDIHHRIMGSEPMMSQMLADVTGYPVKLLRGGGPNEGVAAMQCVDAGTWRDLREAAKALISEGDIFTPNAEAKAEYDKVYEAYKRLYPALKAVFAKEAEK